MNNRRTSTHAELQLLHAFQYVVFGSVILYFGKDVLVPISFAVLISFVLYPVCVWMEKKGVGRLLAIIISISLLVIAGLFVVTLLIFQFMTFLNEWPALQEKFTKSTQEISGLLSQVFGISTERQREWFSQLSNQSTGNIFSFIKSMATTSAFSAVLLVLIPVYSFLILYYRRNWMKIVQRLFPKESDESLHNIISLTIATYYNFIKGMAIVYLVVGILNSIGLLLMGVPHAILFGFIASVLTFIPYIGIMVGSLLPMAIAWITYDSVWYPVGIIALFAFVQYLEANVIFPFAVSSRLNVNTLVMLVAIFVGGILWGLAGMILFVPFVGIAKLIADHNPKWKTISMILGINGR